MGFLLRWLFAFLLLAATYNPTDWNFVSWATDGNHREWSVVVLSGLVLAVGYIIYLRATFRSIDHHQHRPDQPAQRQPGRGAGPSGQHRRRDGQRHVQDVAGAARAGLAYHAGRAAGPRQARAGLSAWGWVMRDSSGGAGED